MGGEISALESLVSVLLALSIAAERLVEIVKGFIPYLNTPKPDPRQEGRRRALLQLLAALAGVVVAMLSQSTIEQVLPKIWDTPLGILALGLLASGGSGLWNSVLTYVTHLKEAKKAEVIQLLAPVQVERGTAAVAARQPAEAAVS